MMSVCHQVGLQLLLLLLSICHLCVMLSCSSCGAAAHVRLDSTKCHTIHRPEAVLGQSG